MAKNERKSKRQGNDGNETQAGKSRIQQTSSKKESASSLARRQQFSPARATTSPFSLMRRFSEEMDRLFGDFNFGGRVAPHLRRELDRLVDLETPTWLPQVEMFERNGKLNIRADLPGLSKDDIDVDISNDAVVIRGERQQEKEDSGEGYYRSERSYGSFYREIPLPSGVNPEEANATFRDGVLEITMPAPERQSQRRRIEIGEGSEKAEQQPRAKTRAAGA